MTLLIGSTLPFIHEAIVPSPPGTADLEIDHIVLLLGPFIKQPIFCSRSANNGWAGTETGVIPMLRRELSQQWSHNDKKGRQLCETGGIQGQRCSHAEQRMGCNTVVLFSESGGGCLSWFSSHRPACSLLSSSNCCFLTCIQISQEAGQVVWFSHLFPNFPQFIVIHTVKGFGIVNKAEVDVFWNSLAFSMIQRMLAIWSLFPLPFLKPAWTSGSSRFTYCWSLAWRILSIPLLVCEMSAIYF